MTPMESGRQTVCAAPDRDSVAITIGQPAGRAEHIGPSRGKDETRLVRYLPARYTYFSGPMRMDGRAAASGVSKCAGIHLPCDNSTSESEFAQSKNKTCSEFEIASTRPFIILPVGL